VELTDDGTCVVATHDGVELYRYVYRPPEAQVESPRPYLHPVRTLGGVVVSTYRPEDHVWHKGIAWSLPNVATENFWGGPTFVRDKGYVQLPNNGAMVHRSFVDPTTHDLDWVTESGETWFTERRTLQPSLVDGGWALHFTTTMTNVRNTPVAIGSPTTEGRDNAGYGGLMWRGPASFTAGEVVLPTTSGGDELMGERAEWLAYRAETATLVFADAPTNPNHPTQWFVRTTPFPCACPAPFFSQETTVAAGETLTLNYAIAIADGTPPPAHLATQLTRGVNLRV
jgi:hypothetical protein